MPRSLGSRRRRSARTVWLVFGYDGRFLRAVPGTVGPPGAPGEKVYRFEGPKGAPEPGRITRLRIQEAQ